MRPEQLALVGGIAFGLSAFVTWRLCQPGSWFQILDLPNTRSLHTRPTPRTGGIAIVTAILMASAVAAIVYSDGASRLGWLGAAALLVAVTSYVDDRVQLSALQRIVVHVIAACLVGYGGFVLDMSLLPGDGWLLASALVFPITALYLVWMVNLYNFMDGMDGFAGGMTLFGFGTLTILGVLAGHGPFAALSLIIAAAAGGFLLFNFPPARIFMGDTGSSTLGLLAGGFSIWGAQEKIFPFWIALLVFSPFIVDSTVTLLRRMLRRETLWEAHRTHYYQRLVQLGWGHGRTVLWEYALMAACAASALLAAGALSLGQWTVIGLWFAAYPLLGFAVHWLESVKRNPR